jgi:prepilin-type N-terminal cleavage/methylation domain-containing protein
MVNQRRGYSLVELMVVSAIVAVIASLGSTLYIKMNTFFRVSIAKIETQRDVRNLMELITREIRQAKSSQISLSQENASQPPYSKITFQNMRGDRVLFWQSGRTLTMNKNGQTTLLSKDLRSIFFSYPSTDNPNLITVLLSIEKTAEAKKTYALQMGGETIRLLND